MKNYVRQLALFSILFLSAFCSEKADAQCVVINEVMSNAPGGCDGACNPSTAEWTELYNTCNYPVDISCYILTSGRFTATIPGGTTIAAHGFYVIGSSNSGGTVNLDIGTCGCTTGSLVGTYTNGADQAILTDKTGAIQSAVYWGGGARFPLNITSAGSGGCSPVTISVPSTANFESVPSTSSNDGCTVSRSCDGSSTWVKSCGSAVTMGASNATPPFPDFFTPDTVICSGTCIGFTNTTTGNTTSLAWTFTGASTTSSASNAPANICYPDTGKFDVTLNVMSACGNFSVTKSAYVKVNAGGNLVASANPPSICTSQSSVMSVVGASNYSWSPSTGLDATTGATVNANPTGTTTYIVTAVGSCAGAADTVVLTVSPSVVITISPADTSVCTGFSVQLTASGSGTFAWSPKATLNDSTIAYPVATPVVTTTYTVTGGACTTAGTVVVTVGNSAVGGHVAAARDTICSGTPGNLTLSGNSSNTIVWQSSAAGTGGYTPVGPVDTAKYKTDPLTQSTWFRAIVGSGGCLAVSDSVQLVVPPALTASFTSTTTGNTVSFNSGGSIGNISNYFWDFGDGATSNDSNPTHTYAKDTTYNPCLTIYDGSNCSYTFCRSIASGIPTISADGSWSIYPNPFGNELDINTNTLNSHVQSIEMYDVLGRVVVSEAMGNANSSAFELNTSALAKGMYFLMIKTADADYVQKVVKQ